MTIKRLLVTCAASLLLTSLSQASNLDDFTRFDVDQDGKLSSVEFSKQATDRGGSRRGGRTDQSIDRFTEADSDGDGYLSLSEYSVLAGQRGSRDRT